MTDSTSCRCSYQRNISGPETSSDGQKNPYTRQSPKQELGYWKLGFGHLEQGRLEEHSIRQNNDLGLG